MSTATNAVAWMTKIAANKKNGYSQSSRWGPDYDCSSFVTSGYVEAGLCFDQVKKGKVTSTKKDINTSNLKSRFIEAGFEDITSTDRKRGEDVKVGDVLLASGHVVTVAEVDKKGIATKIVHASKDLDRKQGESKGEEIKKAGYYNGSWKTVLRYSD